MKEGRDSERLLLKPYNIVLVVFLLHFALKLLFHLSFDLLHEFSRLFYIHTRSGKEGVEPIGRLEPWLSLPVCHLLLFYYIPSSAYLSFSKKTLLQKGGKIQYLGGSFVFSFLFFFFFFSLSLFLLLRARLVDFFGRQLLFF